MTAKLEAVLPVLMCGDLARSIRFYGKLGFHVTFRDDPLDPKYVGLQRDGIQLHLQWHADSEMERGGDRPTYRFRLQDVDGLYAEFCRSGAVDARGAGTSPWRAPGKTPWNTWEFHVQDPDRNGLQFYRPL